MTISTAVEPVRPSDEAAAKRGERRALGVACGAHMLHDGYTDLVWVALPIWQAEFGLNFAMVGLLRTICRGNRGAYRCRYRPFGGDRLGRPVLLPGWPQFGICAASFGAVSGRGLGGYAASDRFGAGDARVQRGAVAQGLRCLQFRRRRR